MVETLEPNVDRDPLPAHAESHLRLLPRVHCAGDRFALEIVRAGFKINVSRIA